MAMVLSSLLGGGLAALVGTRPTFLLTVPFAALSIVAALGFGGLIAGRFHLGRPGTAWVVAALMVLAGVGLSSSRHIVVVAVARVLLALLVVAAGIHVSRLLHDAVPSAVRAGVASGVSTLSWLVFLPVALGLGLLTEHHGVHASGWLITALAAAAGGLLVAMTVSSDSSKTARAMPA